MLQRVHAPEALDQRCAAWPGGRFDAGRRPATPHVRGRTLIDQHLVLVTLSGGARRLDVRTECGHRHVGTDMAGAVSFLPAGRARLIELEDVEAEWASFAFDPDMAGHRVAEARDEPPPLTNVRDGFVFGLVAELDRLHRRDGGIDPGYGEAMGVALALYVARRFGGRELEPAEAGAIPAWKLARIEDFIEANIHRQVSMTELATVAGLSVGRFHRAFHAATGRTPLRFLQEARMRRAAELLKDRRNGVTDVAAMVGFQSPSHFARVFRKLVGAAPSQAR